VREPVVSTPAAPAPCLTKEYLQTGVVLFKDVCTKEWAVNSTTIDRPVTAATARACLTKESPADGVVLFKDVCSNEWAMNPPEQAEAPQARYGLYTTKRRQELRPSSRGSLFATTRPRHAQGGGD